MSEEPVKVVPDLEPLPQVEEFETRREPSPIEAFLPSEPEVRAPTPLVNIETFLPPPTEEPKLSNLTSQAPSRNEIKEPSTHNSEKHVAEIQPQ